jgi:2-keto-4-pentenoate hydratase
MSFDVEATAAALLAARAGGPAVSADAPPPTLDQAYAVQDRVAAARGGVQGWKGGPADPAATRASPIVQVVHSPARFDGRSFRIVGVEPEIAFVMARGFGPGDDPTDGAILAAVASAHVAIEVCDTRIDPWRDADPHWKLADCQANRALVLGDGFSHRRVADTSGMVVVLQENGTVIDVGGKGDPPSGNPRAVLISVVRHLIARRGGVAAGAAITTGSWCGLHEVARGAHVVAAMGEFGRAEVRF